MYLCVDGVDLESWRNKIVVWDWARSYILNALTKIASMKREVSIQPSEIGEYDEKEKPGCWSVF